MNKEKPQVANYRFYKKQTRKVKALAKKLTKAEGTKISEAEVARRAIDEFNPAIPHGMPVRKMRKMLEVK